MIPSNNKRIYLPSSFSFTIWHLLCLLGGGTCCPIIITLKERGPELDLIKHGHLGLGPATHCNTAHSPDWPVHITWLGRVRFVRLVENHHWKWWSKYNLILPFFLRVLFSLATPHIALLRVKIHVYPLPRDPMWPGLGWAGLGWAGWAGLGWATGHFTSVVTSIISPDTKQHYLLLDTCILGVGLQMNI